ncbi:DrsE domain-containing protein [Candidatus Hydrogenisulfobacillus filiaventi]|uniref:DrsE domain-containing protein n=1 Tax=Candidatus Hydrogenisulfobacillus filiaventi TaxID=2707344 RepID=A0A6F8ZHG5_9FIRM|nr:DsrE family protein [Bacillota bacterium]CAB1129204.1 DrsE domain-containing protein [Candidatus Hydrogenisulfobacillus filiaventi]CAB1129226.1 DrsE domain-containing protein [Candidatus Hydrogenisulfobacillus filiaventi]
MAYRVVFHLNAADPDAHRKALANIANLLNELPDAVVELVVQGDALDLVLTGRSAAAAELDRLQEQGVRVAACANTMRARAVTAAELLAGVSVVPSGVGELVRRQQEGWAYIKP